MVSLGLVVFLIGYWFLAVSNGQKQCGEAKSSTNMGGGIAGIVIGLIIMILGIIFGNSVPVEVSSE